MDINRVKEWSKMRGLTKGKEDAQMQFQRFLQEMTEVHMSMVQDDIEELKDALGDTIVQITNNPIGTVSINGLGTGDSFIEIV